MNQETSIYSTVSVRSSVSSAMAHLFYGRCGFQALINIFVKFDKYI